MSNDATIPADDPSEQADDQPRRVGRYEDAERPDDTDGHVARR